jgi:hypothetical protein
MRDIEKKSFVYLLFFACKFANINQNFIFVKDTAFMGS